MKKKQKKKPVQKKKKTSGQQVESPPRDTTVVRGWLSFSLAIIILLSLVSFAISTESSNALGIVGHTTGWVLHAVLGLGSYLLVLYLGWLGWRLLFKKPIHHAGTKFFAVAVLISSSCMLLSVLEDQYPNTAQWLGQLLYPQVWRKKLYYHLGGAPLYYLYRDLPNFNLRYVINALGVTLIFSSTFVASFLYLSKINPANILEWMQEKLGELFQRKESDNDSEDKRFVKLKIPGAASIRDKISRKSTLEDPQEMLAIEPEKNLITRPSLSRKQKAEEAHSFSVPSMFKRKEERSEKPQKQLNKRERALASQRVYNGDFNEFKLPSQSLLTTPKKVDQSSLKKDLKRQAEVLEETLLSFGIEAKVGQINCGPTITSFEVHPAIGVKVQKIKTLENDIALNMEAKSIRIIAPIPGKAAIGIEVPNPQPQEVAFKDMMQAYRQSGHHFQIPVLLGKTVNGDYVMNDLAKMPHCIIAGATGSGKSVCINTIVMSILYNAKPDEIKLIMVDPKKVELTPYSKLPHMLAPVITEPLGACAAMNWLVKEMENRYDILKQVGVRNIASFNSRQIDEDFEQSLGLDIPKRMHYIVAIIDELADLMMVSSNEIETYIARIAQMARAVGIHLILATQRPSREVITGLIKANFPTRVSFKVSSRVNSQIILDDVGAETLLGNGDMLFLPPGSSHLMRAQGAFIRDEDINASVKFICDQAPPNYVIDSFDEMDDLGAGELKEDAPADALYDRAFDIVVDSQNASTTFLQRKLKIGYARAASLIDELEARGVVTGSEGSKPRKVLVDRAAVED